MLDLKPGQGETASYFWMCPTDQQAAALRVSCSSGISDGHHKLVAGLHAWQLVQTAAPARLHCEHAMLQPCPSSMSCTVVIPACFLLWHRLGVDSCTYPAKEHEVSFKLLAGHIAARRDDECVFGRLKTAEDQSQT